MRVFVDASAFISLVVVDDSNHIRAAEIAARLELEKSELVTSSMIIAEVLTVLSMRFSKTLAVEFGARIMKGGVQIIHPSTFSFEHAWQMWKEEPHKDLSFVDAMSFALIEAEHIPSAFSFDHDFLKRGFEILH